MGRVGGRRPRRAAMRARLALVLPPTLPRSGAAWAADNDAFNGWDAGAPSGASCA
jgi:hypothetical protein